ncbi:MAG: hypothetical protein M0Q01_00060 [Syntrophales bacterium]|jgi:hypothetical protein|nr:hypothetical protein [Syntrophales bacterium]
MNLASISNNFSIENQRLHYKLSFIFSLFFLTPIAGFMYFALKYDILNDEYIPVFFIALLAFSFFGFNMLRKMFDKITRIYRDISQVAATELSSSQTHLAGDELSGIVHSFQ